MLSRCVRREERLEHERFMRAMLGEFEDGGVARQRAAPHDRRPFLMRDESAPSYEEARRELTVERRWNW